MLGHAAMYDSVTSVELASLGLVLLLVVSIFSIIEDCFLIL